VHATRSLSSSASVQAWPQSVASPRGKQLAHVLDCTLPLILFLRATRGQGRAIACTSTRGLHGHRRLAGSRVLCRQSNQRNAEVSEGPPHVVHQGPAAAWSASTTGANTTGASTTGSNTTGASTTGPIPQVHEPM